MRIIREADIRYSGQSMEVRVAAPGGAVDAAFVAGADRGVSCRASAHLRLRLCRRATRSSLSISVSRVSGSSNDRGFPSLNSLRGVDPATQRDVALCISKAHGARRRFMTAQLLPSKVRLDRSSGGGRVRVHDRRLSRARSLGRSARNSGHWRRSEQTENLR